MGEELSGCTGFGVGLNPGRGMEGWLVAARPREGEWVSNLENWEPAPGIPHMEGVLARFLLHLILLADGRQDRKARPGKARQRARVGNRRLTSEPGSGCVASLCWLRVGVGVYSSSAPAAAAAALVACLGFFVFGSFEWFCGDGFSGFCGDGSVGMD